MAHAVGDTVYADFGRYGLYDVREGKVIRITPTGQVVVDFGDFDWKEQPILHRFKGGWETGNGRSHHFVKLIPVDQYKTAKVRSDRQKAAYAFMGLVSKTKMPTSKVAALEVAARLTELANAYPEDDA